MVDVQRHVNRLGFSRLKMHWIILFVSDNAPIDKVLICTIITNVENVKNQIVNLAISH